MSLIRLILSCDYYYWQNAGYPRILQKIKKNLILNAAHLDQQLGIVNGSARRPANSVVR